MIYKVLYTLKIINKETYEKKSRDYITKRLYYYDIGRLAHLYCNFKMDVFATLVTKARALKNLFLLKVVYMHSTQVKTTNMDTRTALVNRFH